MDGACIQVGEDGRPPRQFKDLLHLAQQLLPQRGTGQSTAAPRHTKARVFTELAEKL